MNSIRGGAPGRAAALDARQRAVLVAFEEACRAGHAPALADFATLAGELPLLVELARVDLRRRFDAGESVRIEVYLEQWTELAADDEATLALILAEADLRRRSGASIGADEYCRRFPRHAAALPAALEPAQGLGPDPGSMSDGTQTSVGPSLAETIEVGPNAGPSPDFPPGKTDEFASLPLPHVPGYEVIRRIARGGMGEVLEARHVILNRTVAIKMPLPHLISGEADRERFLREARAAAQLRHAHICAIHEIGQAGGCPYIVMDFVRGQTLKQWLVDRGPTGRQSAELVALLARAVAYAHEHGVVHRDLKPSNVLVETESGAPVLTDFGLAKQLDDKSSQLTHSGQVMGTPAYMAPEQAAGHLDRVGPLSDVYSLGAVLYELLCGRPPFAGNVGEVLRQVQTDEPPAPRTLNPRIHRDLETVCLKALAKDPAARYESAAALAADLERFSAGEPIAARRAGPLHRLARTARRRPAMTATIVAVAASLGLAAWLAVKTGGNMEISQLNQAFEAGLDRDEWTIEHLEQMEILAARLASRSPEAAVEARTRLYQRYADLQYAVLRKATLEADDAARVDRALAVLQDRAPELAPSLRKALEDRKSGWETVVDLRPGAAPDEIFAVGSVAGEGQRFVRKTDAGPNPIKPRVETSTASRGKVELEASFDESWRQVAALGLVLNAVPSDPDGLSPAGDAAPGDEGYLFRLGVATPPHAGENGDGDGGENTAAPVSMVAPAGGELVLEIFRDTTRLARQTVNASRVGAGPLRLFAGRHANRLSMQVNDLPPLVFEDVFPLSRARPGVFALLWPPKARLLRLQGRRQSLPPAASPLERGDEAYGRGELAEALNAYREEAIASVGTVAAQEARYKEAICLAALKRPEAQGQLESVAAEKGDRWPVLAACELWRGNMQNRRFDQADAIFEALSSRYTFEQLAGLIPSTLREEILTSYGLQATGFGLYSYDPHRIEHLRRAVEVELLLGATAGAAYGSRWNLLRALHAGGRLDEALALAESMVGDGGAWQNDTRAGNWHEETAWLLCLHGRAEEALRLIDRLVFDESGKFRPAAGWLLLARTRTLAALGRWDEAEHAMDEMFRLSPEQLLSQHRAMLCLVRGLLHERRGDQPGAIEAWRAGFDPEIDGPQNGSTVMANLMLASLSDAISDEQADKLADHLMRSFAGDSTFSVVKGAFRLPPSVVREMWRTPRGRDAARQLAFREVSMQEQIRLPVLVVASEIVRQTAFGGQWTDEQEELAWNVAAESYRLQSEGRLSAAQTIGMAMTWKGRTDFLGWGGLAPALEPGYRAGLAYLLAHRYRALNKREESLRFFDTALADSPPESMLHRLTEREAEQPSAP